MSESPNPNKSDTAAMTDGTARAVALANAAPAAAAKSPAGTSSSTPAVVLGPSPHVHGVDSVSSIMGWVVVAMLPAVLASFWFFGLEAVRVMTISVVACVGVEHLCLRYMKTPGSLSDMSAVVTGILLGMNLPATTPWWIVVAGAIVAMLIAKHLFGGIGSNIFNPALTARVFLLVAWPGQMTTWLLPGTRTLAPAAGEGLLAVTGATPLALLKEGGELPATMNLFLGNIGGSLGEVSAIALILGGLILLWKRVITIEIPATFIGTVLVMAWLARLFGGSETYAPPLFHLFSGGLLLGAIFMATDMVTCPLTVRGRIVFGLGCGILTGVIRLWSGGYPEGVSFAILMMNAVTPLIDNYFKPATFGSKQPAANRRAARGTAPTAASPAGGAGAAA